MNREFQRQILTKCQEAYPYSFKWDALVRLYKIFYSDEILPEDPEELFQAFVPHSFVVLDDEDTCFAFDKQELLTPPQKLMSNLQYLKEHGLIRTDLSWPGATIPDAIITAKGIDFLADDGGLSAILNTLTVKFDVDNARELVATGLLKANVPEEKQGALMKAIREAPGTMLQTAVTKMVEKGMSDPVGTAKAVAALFGIEW
ncbi:MAG: hypothetical protein AB7E51_18830 [Pseudodesulfovibrio sp.]|uniref:hypothetical protein n=1 Tax=Pseudodesulfovibrio sp. TaxID=2035812 RepID=UPI003D0C574B